MANEVTLTAANDLLFDEWATSEVLLEARPLMVHKGKFNYRGNEKSNVMRWTIQDDPGAASGKSEAVDLANTALTTNKATATLGTVGIMATITDELVYAALVDPKSHFAAVLGRSVAEKFEVDAKALTAAGAASNSLGSADTIDDLLAAKANLLSRDTANFGQLVVVAAVDKATRYARDIVSSGSAYWGNPQASLGNLDDLTSMAGFVGAPMGLPIFQSGSAASGAATLFVVGQFIGEYECWAPKTETFRDISNVATEVVATARYAVAELRDAFGEDLSG
jgi:hypothetical protein